MAAAFVEVGTVSAGGGVEVEINARTGLGASSATPNPKTNPGNSKHGSTHFGRQPTSTKEVVILVPPPITEGWVCQGTVRHLDSITRCISTEGSGFPPRKQSRLDSPARSRQFVRVMKILLHRLGLGWLLVGLSLSSVQAAERPAFWLSPKGERPGGSGTQQDPWVVTKPEEFDARMRSIPNQARIHLAPGTFETYGMGAPGQPGFLVKSGWSIEGAGIDQTTVLLVGCVADQQPGSGMGRIFFSGWGAGVEGVVIRNLTADCNYPGVTKKMGRKDISLAAVYLMGRDLRIEKLKAIRTAGLRNLPGGNPETFPIALGPRDDKTDASGYLIEDCEVSQFSGGQLTAIAIVGAGGKNGAEGAIRRNRVLLGGTGGEFAFSAYGARQVVIEQNTTRKATRVFNWDTPAPGRGILIRSNQFHECGSWAFNLGGGRDSVIEHNLIELSGDGALGVQISAANEIFPGAGPWTIRHNTFKTLSGTPTLARFFRNVAVPGCVFEHNKIEGRHKVDPSARDFAVWRNNTDSRRREVTPPRR